MALTSRELERARQSARTIEAVRRAESWLNTDGIDFGPAGEAIVRLRFKSVLMDANAGGLNSAIAARAKLASLAEMIDGTTTDADVAAAFAELELLAAARKRQRLIHLVGGGVYVGSLYLPHYGSSKVENRVFATAEEFVHIVEEMTGVTPTEGWSTGGYSKRQIRDALAEMETVPAYGNLANVPLEKGQVTYTIEQIREIVAAAETVR